METGLNDKVGQVKLVGQPSLWFERWLVWTLFPIENGMCNVGRQLMDISDYVDPRAALASLWVLDELQIFRTKWQENQNVWNRTNN